ncbi:MAG: GNAT family N-acetyltransferase [Rhodococcus sp.]|nr:GNAT family N-acetyltransferase [Rhodococcus sp. (in: high G+C Gram-positive bacteria)]
MSTHVTSLTLDGLDQLSGHARRCVFWEMDPAAVHDSRGFCDQEFEKEAWLSMVMLEWGSCGQVAVMDGKPVGSALYAPPHTVPRARLFPTAPVSADAVLLTSVRLEPAGEERDLGTTLLRAVVADLVRRGVRALEAFGLSDTGDDRPTSDVASATAALQCSPEECMVRSDFLADFGFEVVAPHHRFPRMRLEIDSDIGWKEDVEAALEQLLESAALSMVEIGEKADSRAPVGVSASTQVRSAADNSSASSSANV